MDPLLWALYALYGAVVLPAAVVAVGLRLRAQRVQGVVVAAHRPSRPWRIGALAVLFGLGVAVVGEPGVAPDWVDLTLLSATGTAVALRPFDTDRVCGSGGVRLGVEVASWERLDRWEFDGGRLVVRVGDRSGAFDLPREIGPVLLRRLTQREPTASA